MYLEHFKLSRAPFTLTPNTEFFCELPTHQEALNVLLLSLAQGEGFIKIVGEVGTGKTLLCRILLNNLSHDYVTAYIPNPDQSPDGLRFAIASELGIEPQNDWTQYHIMNAINQKLLEIRQAGKSTVLIIDEAQALPDHCLEAIRLLTNLETEERRLMQVVLFGQPELDDKLNQVNLRQLKQRITFSYHLYPLEREDMFTYLNHRLARGGYTYGSIFTKAAQRRLYQASQGIPRLLNILCHKSLLVAYVQGKTRVNRSAVDRAVEDSQIITFSQRVYTFMTYVGMGALGISLLVMAYQYGYSL